MSGFTLYIEDDGSRRRCGAVPSKSKSKQPESVGGDPEHSDPVVAAGASATGDATADYSRWRYESDGSRRRREAHGGV